MKKKSEKAIQSDSYERRREAYRLLKEVAMDAGVMRHQLDTTGFDEFLNLLASDEFVLIFESKQES